MPWQLPYRKWQHSDCGWFSKKRTLCLLSAETLFPDPRQPISRYFVIIQLISYHNCRVSILKAGWKTREYSLLSRENDKLSSQRGTELAPSHWCTIGIQAVKSTLFVQTLNLSRSKRPIPAWNPSPIILSLSKDRSP